MNDTNKNNIKISSVVTKGIIVSFCLVFFVLILVVLHKVYEKYFIMINNLVYYFIFYI